MHVLTVKTSSRFEMIDITERIREIVAKERIRDGLCLIFVPHTTAAVTINENADPDVPKDMLDILDRLVPLRGGYRHGEGNAAAHAKASLVGPSEMALIDDNRLVLGTWQGIFFCEFDGPRSRKVFVKTIAAP
ncbi:MAG: secondary thiamine-phosphate synthase enzyme YjbQ [Pseudomonadota bacterium]|nr:secondary thiamine-phosphate synthase enzyme YjbQ [Pseudomonadota bacterium]